MSIRHFITLIAIITSLVLTASAQAAPVWTPPTNLSTLTTSSYDPLVDVTPSGDSFGGGRNGFRVSLRRPGGSFSEQVLPSGGSTQVPQYADVAVDLAASNQGIVAWRQSNGLFYALRRPGRSARRSR